MSTRPRPAEITAAEWHATMTRPALAEFGCPGAPFQLRHYVDTPAEIEQPALSDDVICLHLGGPKRVIRGYGMRTSSHDVALGAPTLMPRQECNRWQTIGPIDYVHLILGTNQIAKVSAGEFGCERDNLHLGDDVGFRDPMLELLFGELLRIARDQGGSPGRLYVESVVAVFIVALLRTRSTIAASSAQARADAPMRGGLGGWRLRRVTAYLDAHLAEDVGLEALTELTGLSRAQFFRAFRQSTGLTPSRFLERLRVDRARPLIAAGQAPEMVAQQVGMTSTRRLASGFQRHLGISPAHYRRWSR